MALLINAFNAELSSGAGVDEALATLQLDVNGNPIKPALKTPDAAALMTELRNRLSSGVGIPVTPYLTNDTVGAIKTSDGSYKFRMGGWAEGGYTGAGGKYEPAGIVHKDEFVFTKEATRAIGTGNLYALMRSAQGGRSAPRGRGYATGGIVGGSGSMGVGGTVVVELSARDRALLAAAGNVQLNIDGRVVADSTNAANFVSTKRGSS
jgi:hypothetical protein